MSNPLDTDAGSEMFASYENELKLVQADLNQKLDQIAEASGEQRKAAIRQAEQVLDEATELVRASKFTTPSSKPRRCRRMIHDTPTTRTQQQLTNKPPRTAGPDAHGEAKHPVSLPLKSQPAIPELLNGHR